MGGRPLTVTHLDRVIPVVGDDPEVAGADHPMRRVTEQVAFEPHGWTPERAAKVSELFNGLAAEWHTRDGPGRQLPLDDAIARGGSFSGRTLELGSGTGMATGKLVADMAPVVCVDLSIEMLRLAPPIAPRLLGDGSRLPFPDATFGAVVLINMFLFPAEVARVLGPDGAVVWVNSIGTATPIHLTAEDVDRALPGEWTGAASEAGWGTWAVFRRS